MTTPEVDDHRNLPFMATGRESLESWLEFYRETLPIKVGGLTAEQMCTASVPPSPLTLIGIVRHLTEVEQYWFSEVVPGTERDGIYCSEQSHNGDLDDYRPEDVMDDLQRFTDQLQISRDRAAAVADLDAPVAGKRGGESLNLQWILVHMIEEYARHLGHVDLLREAIDGRTGY